MRSPVVELLAALHDALEPIAPGWYLFGAQAALLYGAARLTADVDITVDAGAHSAAELIAVLHNAGFTLRVADADQFVARTRVIPLVHAASGIPVDVVLAGAGLEERFLQRAQVREIEGVRVRVASAEDIVVMKVLAGRAKDLDDVRAILGAHPTDFDRDLVRNTLKELEQALGRSDLATVFERVGRRRGRATERWRPLRRAKRRGRDRR
jgi:hypothetical protein